MVPSDRITGEQIRAARALARLDQLDLARMSGVSLETIKRLETIRGPVDAHVRTLDAILNAFLSVGVQLEFAPALGVRLVVVPGDGAEPPEGGVGHRPDDPAGAPDERRGGVERTRSKVNRIIYCSTLHITDAGDMVSTLDDVFAVSQARNARLDVTGALLARDGKILQLLEGPHEATREIYASIRRDPRHHSVVLIEERFTGYRRFADWALMGRDALLSARESDTEADGARSGFRPEGLTAARALRLLMTLRRDAGGSGGANAGSPEPDARSQGNG